LILIKNSRIRLFGYGILLLSIIAFLLTWLKWYIGISASLLLLVGYYKIWKNMSCDESKILISKKTFFLICGIMIIWTLLSGIGGAFPQKNDFHIRNAIIHDLINYPWPVRYLDNYDSALTYYIGFWILPALLGKLITFYYGANAGWIVANIAYAIYCATILCVVMFLLVSYLNATSIKRMLMVATILIFFSGMDILPNLLMQMGQLKISIFTQLEFWIPIQYSSNTTQLCWVYNQAIPSWLVTALLFHERGFSNYAYLGLLLLPFGPLPFIGIFFMMMIQGVIEFLQSIRNKQSFQFLKNITSIPNVIAIVTILPIFYLYYFTNSAVSQNGFRLNNISLVYYYVFILTEFLLYVILIVRKSYKKRYFIIGILGLFLAPLFTLGYDQDFCMRASIPFLFTLMIYVMEYLLSNVCWSGKGIISLNVGAILIIMILFIGSATPLTEYRHSYVQIVNSGNTRTSLIKDNYGTLADANIGRGNFVTDHASETIFYRYLARNNLQE
jgi:hypothetical protein